MRFLSIIGARPQFIKHAVLQKQMKYYGIDEVLLHTGQHFDFSMSDVFFQDLRMKTPDILLQTDKTSSLLQLSSMLLQMEQKLDKQHFDCILTYGDTTSTLAGSLFAKERGIKLVHIEAGLRSRDLSMPEERNRIIADHMADFLFAPTTLAYQNLIQENVSGVINVSGDVMYDSFLYFSPKAQKPKNFQIPQDYILCTLHRQGNVDCEMRLRFLLEGLGKVGKHSNIVLPLHPRTQKRIQDFNLKIPDSICVIPPQGYLQTLWLLICSKFVFTDSGGLQKEAYFAKKKCLVLRETSEWVELVESGACELLENAWVFEKFEKLGEFNAPDGLYGDGRSADKILQQLTTSLTN